VYAEWAALGAVAGGREAQRVYCFESVLSQPVLEGISAMRAQFARQLRLAGFGGAAASAWAGDYELVRCAVCAALCPRVAQLARPTATRPLALRTRAKEVVFPHPGSVNYTNVQMYGRQPGRAPSFLVFHSCVETTKAYLHDSTFVGKYALLLFGSGGLRIAAGKGRSELGTGTDSASAWGRGKDRAATEGRGKSGRDCLCVVDGWIRLRMPEAGAVLCKLLRREIDGALRRRVRKAGSSSDADANADADADADADETRLVDERRDEGLTGGVHGGGEGPKAAEFSPDDRAATLALAAVRELLALDKRDSYAW
jgi:hypothetical protein